jgi:hypothetical protein
MSRTYRTLPVLLALSFALGAVCGYAVRDRKAPALPHTPLGLAALLSERGLPVHVVAPVGYEVESTGNALFLDTSGRRAEEVRKLTRHGPEGWGGTVFVKALDLPLYLEPDLPPSSARARVGRLVIDGDPALVRRIEALLR